MDVTKDHLQICSQEPIHTPGAIQPPAALIGLGDDGRVLLASENIGAWIGVSVEQILGRTPAEALGAHAELLSVIASIPTPGSRLALHRPGELAITHANAQGIRFIEFHRVDPAAAPMAEALGAGIDSIIAAAEADSSQESFFQRCVDLLRQLTGFDRVLVYRLHDDDFGEVIAESRGDRLRSLFGLHFPGSDIPAQARDLYRHHRVRGVADAGYVPVPLVADARWRGGPIDLSRVSCRSVSPMHREYMRNLGVAASASVSIVVHDRLWGMFLLHHAEPRALPVELAAALEWLGRTASLQVVQTEQRTVAEAKVKAMRASAIEQQLIEELERTESLAEAFGMLRSSILGLLEADGVALMLDSVVWRHGITPPDAACIALLDRVLPVDRDGPAAVDDLDDVFDAEAFSPLPGVLATRFGAASGNGVLWFRREVPHTITWAGDPAKAVDVHVNGITRVMPRRSFDAWRETIRGRSRAWRRWEILAAAELREALGERILRMSRLHQEIKRRQASEADLRRVNDDVAAFASLASHDLKEPVRGMSMLLELLSRSAADRLQESDRAYIRRALAAAGKMRSIIAGILDLARTSQGVLHVVPVNLNNVIDTLFADRADEIGELHGSLTREDLPMVQADLAQITAVFDNLIGNAIKFRKPGQPPVVRITAARSPSSSAWNFRVSDDGVGIAAERLPLAFQPFRRCGVAPAAEGTGLGLAMCRRIAERHGGDASIQSTPGVGTTVTVTWPDRVRQTADAALPGTP